MIMIISWNGTVSLNDHLKPKILKDCSEGGGNLILYNIFNGIAATPSYML